MKRGRGFDSFDPQLVQGPVHAGDRFVARRPVDDQLADHRIVVRRHRVAGVSVRIPADAGAAGDVHLLDQARARLKVAVGVFGVDAALDRRARG